MEKIAAVVVTFNRLALLKLCLTALADQKRKLDCIIIVNNGSTDGTEEYLAQQSSLEVINQQNLGGAGGFFRGTKHAFEGGYDWVWLMDDDAFPDTDCLSKMLESGRPGKADAVFAPLVIEGNRIDHLHRGQIDLTQVKYPLQTEIINEPVMATATPISFVSFIGMLIGKEVIAKIGFPLSEYFIFHDDVEYSIRITKGGFSMFLIKDALIYHKIPGEKSVLGSIENSENNSPAPPRKQTLREMYYDKRNKYSDKSTINVLVFIGLRNWIWTVIQHNGISLAFVRILAVHFIKAVSYVTLSKANNLLLFKIYFNVFRQGLSGKFDNTAMLALKNKLTSGIKQQ